MNTLPSTEIEISSSSVTTQDFFEQIDACTSVEEINKISAHYKEEWLISKFWEAFFKVLTSTSELEKARAMSKCRYINRLYSSSIPITSRIKRFLTPHGFSGIFISAYAKIGSGCVLFQNVTVGSNTLLGSKNAGFPQVGDNVYIGAGAKIIGNVKIGNNVRIGAGCCVTQDVEDNCTVVAASPVIIKKNYEQDNRYVRAIDFIRKKDKT